MPTKPFIWSLRGLSLAVAVVFLSAMAILPNWAQANASQASSATSSAQSSPSQEQTEPSGNAAPLPRGKKLILTDGTFQIVREYQRQGERVRYFSVERAEWEELPASMIDWPATEKAAAETDAAQKATLEKLHAEQAVEISNTIDTGSSLLVGPGVFLPDSAGLYVLNGQTVLGLIQTEATSRIDKGRAILKGISGIPLISSKRIIEIPGKQAKVRVQTLEPEFFFRTIDGRAPQMTLVKADVNGEKRRVTTAVTDMVGQTKYESQEVAVMVSDAARGVQRLTMSKMLEPGEYALIEMTTDGISSYVWDFGVDGAGSPPKNGSNAKAPAASKSKQPSKK